MTVSKKHTSSCNVEYVRWPVDTHRAQAVLCHLALFKTLSQGGAGIPHTKWGTFDVAVQEAVTVHVPQPQQDLRGVLAHQREGEAPEVIDEPVQCHNTWNFRGEVPPQHVAIRHLLLAGEQQMHKNNFKDK